MAQGLGSSLENALNKPLKLKGYLASTGDM